MWFLLFQESDLASLRNLSTQCGYCQLEVFLLSLCSSFSSSSPSPIFSYNHNHDHLFLPLFRSPSFCFFSFIRRRKLFVPPHKATKKLSRGRNWLRSVVNHRICDVLWSTSSKWSQLNPSVRRSHNFHSLSHINYILFLQHHPVGVSPFPAVLPGTGPFSSPRASC